MADVKMVDITGKPLVYREAEAEGTIHLKRETLNRVRRLRVEKGNVVEVAKIAAIQAVKKTPAVIPLCHPIKITSTEITHQFGENSIIFTVKVKSSEQTGVEMEALTGVSVALLTVWDMVKMYEKDNEGNYPDTKMENIYLKYKVKRSLG